MTLSNGSVMIFEAVFFACGGLVIWLVGRRRDPHTGRFVLVGVPGVYISSLPVLGAPKWLYIPGLALLASTVVMQVAGWRRG